jgi:hypothetical protein
MKGKRYWLLIEGPHLRAGPALIPKPAPRKAAESFATAVANIPTRVNSLHRVMPRLLLDMTLYPHLN